MTGQSDLYSLGVVLFELLTGRSPYQTESLTGLLQAIMSDEPVKVRALRPSLPAQLDDIVAKALAKDCSKRFRAGAEFAVALAELLERDIGAPAVTDDEKFTRLRKVAFFDDFSDPELWEVIHACRWCDYKIGKEKSLRHTPSPRRVPNCKLSKFDFDDPNKFRLSLLIVSPSASSLPR